MDLSKSQLNISHLKMICTIAQAETVKEAAESLFITQPALSNRIREAERRLKTKLFTRRGRKLIITTAGERLLHSAKKILEELARAEHDIARLSSGIELVLRLGLPHYASFRWLPDVMRQFNEHLPGIELEITANAAKQPLTALFHGEVEIAIVSSANQQLSLDNNLYGSEFLLEDELLACLSARHNKAEQRFLTAQDFVDETYITNSVVPEKDREYELFFQPENIMPRKVLQVGFNDAIVELVKANIGVTIMSKNLIEPHLATKTGRDAAGSKGEIQTVRLGKSGVKIYWHLVYVKQPHVDNPVKLLTKTLKR
ncbi:LysR family transcriptional regulator [Thalassomonas haliotis]|uniref:LysR family transcriptional regulator n=1 Tax=Thalassomonas haliotis TaxID=485448 RepID=A0ABY7VL94_9GAMM|nr:LysR family transcriptional regulator [Thalassomonas haliotis]WDE13780.1 LysR family transcriptional regulator [Thalassomonas haliotis]